MKKLISLFIVISFVISAQSAFCESKISGDDYARFGIAQSLVNLGKFDEALEKLRQLHQAYPQNRDITLALARALGYSLKVDEARVLLDDLLKKYPDDSEIKLDYANILEANQLFSEARKIYQELSQANPGDQDLKEHIADVSAWMGDYELAVKYYQELIKQNPDNQLFKLKLADTSLWSKNYSQAVESYSALGVDPKSDKEHFKNLGDAYLGMKNYAKALDIYNQLLKIYPDDLQIKLTIANALYGAGKISEAKKLFEELMRQKPGDVKIMVKFAEILALRQQYPDAIKVCEGILKIEPKNNLAKLWLARILSWNTRYPEALKLYDEIIQQDPQWIIARREKARVLGWMRKYTKSAEEYQKIFKEVRPDKTAETEMRAKNNFFKFYDILAIKNYKKWLQLEPENLEALYDLGQCYARQMQWPNARKTYESILDIIPEHFRAQEALDKVNLYAHAPQLESGFEFYEADSSGREVDEKYYNLYASYKVPVKEDLYLKLRQDIFMLLFGAPSRVNRNRTTIGFEYYHKPWFWAILNYAYSDYSDKLTDTSNFNEEFNIKPWDFTLLTLSHRREDILDNGRALEINLMKDDYKAREEFYFNRRFTLAGDFMYTYYNDHNRKNTYGADASYIVLFEPKFLKLIYRYEEYQFAHQRDYLFTPSSFHTNSWIIMWRHFLNKEELFWGSNNIYYTFKYGFNIDSPRVPWHSLYFDFHCDWNDKFSTHLEWSKKIYDHQSIYREDRVTLYCTYYF